MLTKLQEDNKRLSHNQKVESPTQGNDCSITIFNDTPVSLRFFFVFPCNFLQL